jgi:hypothetical protein
MRILLLTFFTFAQPTANKIIETSSPQNVLQKYFRCFQNKNLAKADSCAKKYISSQLPTKEQDRLRTWPLAYHFQLGKIAPCARKILTAASYYPLSTDTYLCGTLKISTHNEDAIFFFNRDPKGTFFLYSIFY